MDTFLFRKTEFIGLAWMEQDEFDAEAIAAAEAEAERLRQEEQEKERQLEEARLEIERLLLMEAAKLEEERLIAELAVAKKEKDTGADTTDMTKYGFKSDLGQQITFVDADQSCTLDEDGCELVGAGNKRKKRRRKR